MPCYSPLRAWRGGFTKNGKRSVVFSVREAELPEAIDLPCGQCIGCRLERSRQWAMRCVHEASMYGKNCFITLTYAPEYLPSDGSVDVREVQLFMKKLRKAFPKDRIRFFLCAEYGSELARPHYHACLFNFDFEDKYFWMIRNGNKLYRSPKLESIWGKGFCLVGEVTFESAAYVARYIMKKITGEDAIDHYVDKNTGEVKKPEFVTMSRGGKGGLGGIGKRWFERYVNDVFPSDFVVMRGKKMKPPKYYDKIYDGQNPNLYDKIRETRIRQQKKKVMDNDSFRLPVKEEVKRSQIRSLIRKLEESHNEN